MEIITRNILIKDAQKWKFSITGIHSVFDYLENSKSLLQKNSSSIILKENYISFGRQYRKIWHMPL